MAWADVMHGAPKGNGGGSDSGHPLLARRTVASAMAHAMGGAPRFGGLVQEEYPADSVELQRLLTCKGSDDFKLGMFLKFRKLSMTRISAIKLTCRETREWLACAVYLAAQVDASLSTDTSAHGEHTWSLYRALCRLDDQMQTVARSTDYQCRTALPERSPAFLLTRAADEVAMCAARIASTFLKDQQTLMELSIVGHVAGNFRDGQRVAPTVVHVAPAQPRTQALRERKRVAPTVVHVAPARSHTQQRHTPGMQAANTVTDDASTGRAKHEFSEWEGVFGRGQPFRGDAPALHHHQQCISAAQHAGSSAVDRVVQHTKKSAGEAREVAVTVVALGGAFSMRAPAHPDQCFCEVCCNGMCWALADCAEGRCCCAPCELPTVPSDSVPACAEGNETCEAAGQCAWLVCWGIGTCARGTCAAIGSGLEGMCMLTGACLEGACTGVGALLTCGGAMY